MKFRTTAPFTSFSGPHDSAAKSHHLIGTKSQLGFRERHQVPVKLPDFKKKQTIKQQRNKKTSKDGHQSQEQEDELSKQEAQTNTHEAQGHELGVVLFEGPLFVFIQTTKGKLSEPSNCPRDLDITVV